MNAIQRQLFAASTGKDARLNGLALMAVLGLGLCLRLIDIGQPFHGYHMWNETYYVTIARNFDHFGLLNSYNYDWRGGSELGQRHGPSPFVPWLVHFSSHLFGKSEAAARLPILILGMFSLLAIYFIARELHDAEVALIASFLAAIMPGVVFISRQWRTVQCLVDSSAALIAQSGEPGERDHGRGLVSVSRDGRLHQVHRRPVRAAPRLDLAGSD
jgi:hypothetical protein